MTTDTYEIYAVRYAHHDRRARENFLWRRPARRADAARLFRLGDFYANFEEMRAYATVYNVGDMLEGFTSLKRHATSIRHVVPGHDPLVLRRYPAAKPGLEGIAVRLDVEPRE
jgi:hypothetical protein